MLFQQMLIFNPLLNAAMCICNGPAFFWYWGDLSPLYIGQKYLVPVFLKLRVK